MPQFIARFGNALFLIYIGGSVIFLFLLESLFNGGFGMAMKLLWLPLAILVFGFTWWYRRDFYDMGHKSSKVWWIAGATFLCLLLMGWPYTLAFNALTASGESVTYSGQIIKKWISHGRTKGYQIVIMDEASREAVTLTTSSSEYAKLLIGDSIQKSFWVGGLGVPFRWKYRKSGQAIAPDPSLSPSQKPTFPVRGSKNPSVR